ncbi:FKBP-type peptidyl-prolyl cis-trans isomerase [Undibacterium fentianense]|uniref:Peptidyl-prolyl cis-trans isomerase n=1 Tax=Undibacterium fentianense TaxID=2828728 RepID=A0A941ICV1_9BURK|nr:FKBP-type peptidyl-prolyl cis-trans isomerase [Undibacterium fentianense]MBR7800599.1 FKBP-type peptidyl-prolyl cis-trans isomerase [Undibacterium fentianense]
MKSPLLISIALATHVCLVPAHAQDQKTEQKTEQKVEQKSQQESSASAAATGTSNTAVSQEIPAPVATPVLEKIDTVVGTGNEAVIGKTVVVHYTGWLRDPQAENQRGKSFDSSVGRAPFSFNLGEGRVIRGWEQGVPGMKVGGKRTLMIPSTLAYGSRGAGKGVIPPDADLIFDIELLDVIKMPEVEKIDSKLGKGDEAKSGNTVTVHYTGWLRDPKAKGQKGKEFDSSVKREPFSFTINGGEVIRGWDLGVQGMKVGGKRTLIIPAALAYGARDVGNGLIPANSDLIFDVQLLKVSATKK